MKSILCQNAPLSPEDLRASVEKQGFCESLLYIIPKINSGEWSLVKKEDGLYCSMLSEDFYVPLTDLQKSYLKTILCDEKIQLFLDEEEIGELLSYFQDTPLLWQPSFFHYYDQFTPGDDYSQPLYRQNFRTLLTAIDQKLPVDINYSSKTGHRVHHHYRPARLEYSIRNNMFRLLAIEKETQLKILNLSRIRSVTLMEKTADCPDLNQLIKKSYYKEPARLLIHNYRNALERAMLQFANYEKNTSKIAKDTYECLIYYNITTETELLIEILSFGPMIEVLGNERLLGQLKRRLRQQQRLQHPQEDISD